MTFRDWLKEQKKRDDPVGDLARDALIDREWKGKTAVSLLSRFNDLGYPDRDAYAAFCSALDEYSRGNI